jgi:psiF repeat
MQIMKTHLLVIACLSLPLSALSAPAAPEAKAARKPAVAASAPAAAASAVNPREALRASKTRSSSMGACQRQAADQNLNGDARRQFVLGCLGKK